jgi:putative ABC transport system permease protein
LTGGLRPALAVLMVAVGFCAADRANVASLPLARVARRERDPRCGRATRAGGGSWQLMVESGLLALAGGPSASWSASSRSPCSQMALAATSRLTAAQMDGRALAIAAVVSVVTALLFGIVPALQASRPTLSTTLGEGGRSGTASRLRQQLRSLLVAAEVALAVVLLVGAGLMIKSVGRLVGVNPGFDAEHVLTVPVSLIGPGYAKTETVIARTEALVGRLRSCRAEAAAAGQIPLDGNGDTWASHRRTADRPRRSAGGALSR